MDSLRTAVVTGGTSGIGREVALQLAELGWRVIAIGRDREALVELSRRSERLVPHAADLLTDELEELIPAQVDALVHAAGISPSTGVEETTPGQWERSEERRVGTEEGPRRAQDHGG